MIMTAVQRATARQLMREAAGPEPSRRIITPEHRAKMDAGRAAKQAEPQPSLPSDTQPVHCADIDYLASRAGERRRYGQTYSQTQHILNRAQQPDP